MAIIRDPRSRAHVLFIRAQSRIRADGTPSAQGRTILRPRDIATLRQRGGAIPVAARKCKISLRPSLVPERARPVTIRSFQKTDGPTVAADFSRGEAL